MIVLPTTLGINSVLRQVTQQQVADTLRAAGVRPGDSLLVHSALQYLGQPIGGVGMYYMALHSILEGEPTPESQFATRDSPLHSGTLAVPAFNFAFARGEAYDPKSTPSVGMGAFSEYVRRLPYSLRTAH
ncbi:MAG: AAC(3) family N-acetyltransferase, partial [Anaerolineales bacterium]